MKTKENNKCQDTNHAIPFEELNGMTYHESLQHEEDVFNSFIPNDTPSNPELINNK